MMIGYESMRLEGLDHTLGTLFMTLVALMALWIIILLLGYFQRESDFILFRDFYSILKYRISVKEISQNPEFIVIKGAINSLRILFENIIIFGVIINICVQLSSKNNDYLRFYLIIGLIIGFIICLMRLKKHLKNEKLFPSHLKNQLLVVMDEFYHKGFTAVLVIIISLILITNSRSQINYLQLNITLSMLPYTIYSMKIKMLSK